MIRTFHVAAAIVLLSSTVGRTADPPADAPKNGVLHFGSLRAPTLDAARMEAKAWLDTVKSDDASRAAFDTIWNAPDTPLLDRVALTLTLGDEQAAKLLAYARDSMTSAPNDIPGILRDLKRPHFFRSNLALAYAKALTNKRVYEEALESLKVAVPEKVVDPAGYYFHKAVAEHALIQKREAVNSITRLLDDVADVPERYKMVATLIFLDMQGWKDDDKDLGQIARLMDNSERRLDLGRAGPKTQEIQKKIVFRLDELIKDIENQMKSGQQAQCPGGGQQPGSGTNRPSTPMPDSRIQTNSGPGMVDPKKLQHLAENWGKLPEKQRAKAMMELTKDLPPRYREVIENYFKTLAESGTVISGTATFETNRMAWRWTAALVLLTAGAAAAADIQTLSGKKLSGEPVGLDKQALILKTADGEIRHPLADILQINLAANDAPPVDPWVEIELTDGSILNCAKVEFRAKSLAVVLVNEISVEAPYTAIASICRDAHDPRIRAEFRQLAARRAQADMVVVRSEGKLNALDGALTGGLATGDGMEFAIAGSDQKSNPKLAKVAGFVFVNRTDPNAAPAICRITDSGRSVVAVSAVTWDPQGIDVATPTGLKWRYPNPTTVVRLDFSRGKLVWLSDLTPSRADVTIGTEDNGNFGKFVRYRADKNLENGPLRLDGTIYAKGLGLHAGTVLVYELGGDYNQFRAVMGVDESVQSESSVELIVTGDGRELYRGGVSRSAPARPLTLDVRGVQQLRFEVRPTGLLELGGEIDLADAKVSK